MEVRPPDTTEQMVEESSTVELAIYPPMTHTVPDAPYVGPDQMLVYKTSKQSGTRRLVTQRDDDLLTPEEVRLRWREVEAAMLKELRTWAELKCFSRKARHQASNVIDVRWVLKNKWEQPTVDVSTGGSGTTEAGKPVKSIRARLTVRGFKDTDKGDVDRYAGTSARSSQKVLVSEAVLRGWDICTADISTAFLQGVTYEELARLTGKKQREVNFYLPASNIPLLQKVPGFEDFNPAKEVLHCDKPGTGLVDAPLAFSIKLSMVTRDKCNLIPSKIDPEFCCRHDKGELVCIMTKHVDDLKIAGRPAVVQQVLAEIQKVFGELKIVWKDFTNCGTRHCQDPVTKEITLDQIEYAQNLRPIAHPELKTAGNEALCSPPLHQLYMSLLGAVAYLAHTRVDALVFISALQRHNSKPQVIHVKRLNKLLAWLQAHPKKLTYRRFGDGGRNNPEAARQTHLRIVSDAAFKREGDTGHCLRGAVFLRAPGQKEKDFTNSSVVHMIEWVCKGQRHVARSTFAAELLSAGDATDQGLLLA